MRSAIGCKPATSKEGSRSARFVARHAGRYLRGNAAQRALDLLLANTPPVFAYCVLQRYGIAVNSTPLPARISRRVPLTTLEYRYRESSTFISSATLVRELERRTLEQRREYAVPARMLGRLERRDAEVPKDQPALAAVSGHSASAPAVRAAEHILPLNSLRPTVTGAEAGAQTAVSASTLAPRGQPHTTLADREIDRVTQRVIQNIDRRIVAHRERLGRA
jgi:hypothetical protein